MRTLNPLTLFFSKLFLHILDHLHFHMNFRISVLISTQKKQLRLLTEPTWNL